MIKLLIPITVFAFALFIVLCIALGIVKDVQRINKEKEKEKENKND